MLTICNLGFHGPKGFSSVFIYCCVYEIEARYPIESPATMPTSSYSYPVYLVLHVQQSILSGALVPLKTPLEGDTILHCGVTGYAICQNVELSRCK